MCAEVYSSVETVNECDAMIREKNVPLRTKGKPKLTSTKSLPNVHERMKKREVKMQYVFPKSTRKNFLSEK